MKIAVIGATGLVGATMLKVLEERNFPVTKLIPVASERSKGKKVMFCGNEIAIHTLEELEALQPDFALFSAGGEISRQWAPRLAARGIRIIDNSSAWRMAPDIPLVVPEVNGHVLSANDFIIANPNCSTIQMVMALFPLQQAYGIERIVVSTYQSISGTGSAAISQMEDERSGRSGPKVYPHPIDLNCLPHCDVFLENGYTKEEMKLVNETRKILNAPGIQVSATAVRVPVSGGHSESVNVVFEKDFELEDIYRLLGEMPGVVVKDDPGNNEYPMPLNAAGKDDVFVGRIRRDFSHPRALNLWIVADNLRKGAATNAVQIAEYLLENKLIEKAAEEHRTLNKSD